MSGHFQTQLKEIWVLRNSQKLDAAEKSLRQLTASSSNPSQRSREEIDLKILEASILRARNDVITAEGLLMGVKERLETENLPIPDQYYLQRGLNLFFQGYFPSALEFFVSCQDLTEDDNVRALAIGNHFVCLDILNLPSKKTVQKLKDLKTVLAPEYYAQVIAPPLKSFESKQKFREGQLRALFNIPLDTHLGQSEYIQLWASQLPYVNGSLCQSDISRLLETPHLVWKKFRTHTLTRDARHEDLSEVKVSEHIDRLYLWIWKWMTAPEQMSAVALENCWHGIDPLRVCNNSTAEDLVLLKLSLRWCRLFDPRWEVPSEEWMKKSLPPTLQESPLLALEGQVLDYLESMRRKNSALAKKQLKSLQQNSLFLDPDLKFKELIEGFQKQGSLQSPMGLLGQRLAKMMSDKKVSSKNKKPTSNKDLWIDLPTSRWKKGKDEGVSEPLCLLVNSLARTESISFSDVMTTCFGFQFYDEDLHRNKIMNLLTRVRKILPSQAKLFTRQQRIYIQNPLTGVHINTTAGLQAQWQLPPLFARACIQQNQFFIDRWIQPRLLVKKLNGHDQLTRQEAQDMFQLSKATANRLLKRWSEEGFLEKRQAGRNVRYHVDNRYFSRLNTRDS